MKKLLEILGTITIASSGIAGIVANSPYQKEESIKNSDISDINYQQTNSTEILKRTKRQNKRKPINIYKLFLRNNYSRKNRGETLSGSLEQVINSLVAEKAIIRLGTASNHRPLYAINPDVRLHEHYFLVIPVITENQNETDNNRWQLEFVLRPRDFYIDGFILRNQNERHYYYLSDAIIRSVNNQNDNTNLRTYDHNLGFEGNYNNINVGINQTISWGGIITDLDYLNNLITHRNVNNNNANAFSGITDGNVTARRAIRSAALLIAESLRLRPVFSQLQTLSRDNSNVNWSVFEEFILNWDNRSTSLVTQSQLSPASNNGEWRHEFVGTIASQIVRILSIAAVNSLPIKCSGNFNPNSNRQVRQIYNNCFLEGKLYLFNINNGTSEEIIKDEL